MKTLSFPPEIFKMKMAENQNQICMAHPTPLGEIGDRIKITGEGVWQIQKIMPKTTVTLYSSTYFIEAGFRESVNTSILTRILNAVYGTQRNVKGYKFKWSPDLFPHYLTRVNPNTREMNYNLNEWGIK